MNKIYAYPKCSTCQKALKKLNDLHVEYKLIDIKENNPDYKEIKRLFEKSNQDIKKFFNTSGLVYKELKLKEKLEKMTLEEKIEILSTNGMLIKRPILEIDNLIIIGFKEKEYEEFSKNKR